MNLYFDSLKYFLPTLIVVIVSFYVAIVFSDIFIINLIFNVICGISGMILIVLLYDFILTAFLRLKYKNVHITVKYLSHGKDKPNWMEVSVENQWIASLPRVGEFISFNDIVYVNTGVLFDEHDFIKVKEINHISTKSLIYCTTEKIPSVDIKNRFEDMYKVLKQKDKNFRSSGGFGGYFKIRSDLLIGIEYDYDEEYGDSFGRPFATLHERKRKKSHLKKQHAVQRLMNLDAHNRKTNHGKTQKALKAYNLAHDRQLRKGRRRQVA